MQNDLKVKILVRGVAKEKLKKARFYAAFRVSQLPNIISHKRRIKHGNVSQLQGGGQCEH